MRPCSNCCLRENVHYVTAWVRNSRCLSVYRRLVSVGTLPFFNSLYLVLRKGMLMNFTMIVTVLVEKKESHNVEGKSKAADQENELRS